MLWKLINLYILIVFVFFIFEPIKKYNDNLLFGLISLLWTFLFLLVIISGVVC